MPARVVLLLGVLLSACSPSGKATTPDPVTRAPDEDRAIAAAVAAWLEAGRAVEDTCPLAALDVQQAKDADAYRKVCSSEVPGQCTPPVPGRVCSASCLPRPDTRRTVHIIMLAPAQILEPDGEPVIHETLHLLLWCERDGDYDREHADEGVWKAHGTDTIQWLAGEKFKSSLTL